MGRAFLILSITWCLMAWAGTIAPLLAEVLPSADAPVFFDAVKDGKPAVTLVLPADASATERVAGDKLVEWFSRYAQIELPVIESTGETPVPHRTTGETPVPQQQQPRGHFILLGTADNQPLIASRVKESDGGAADVPFLSDEGFGIETLTRGDAKYLVIAGRTAKGVLHGAIYARDFLLDIVPPDKGVVIREVKLVRSPALEIRGPYLLPQYGVTPQYTLEHWKHIVDGMAEGGINQIHWWVAGMYPSERFPETFEITSTKMSIEDLRELCRFAQDRGMTFLVGGGGFFWHGVQALGNTRPEIRSVGSGGLCPSHPESQRLMLEYALEWLEIVPEADGIWIEPRDEGGACKCDLCEVRLDEFNSKQYGQSEITWLKSLMKQVWERNPNHKLVWLVEFLQNNAFVPHYDAPLYFERIREIKDSRIEWMVVWEQWKLPGPRNELTPVPFFTRHALHWDKPYWPNLQHVFAHARQAAEQGYLGYSNAWEIGFGSNDWYRDEVPYPVDLIPETITRLGFREACWEPGQTWDDFTDRVHRRFFSREVPRSVAEDMLYLRQYITSANHEFRSPMTYGPEKPLLAEIERVRGLDDPEQREAAAKPLMAVIEVLRETRDETLPRMARIESDLAALEAGASRKSKEGFELIRRAIADSRRVYEQAVPEPEVLDRALMELDQMRPPPAAAPSAQGDVDSRP